MIAKIAGTQVVVCIFGFDLCCTRKTFIHVYDTIQYTK